jgi:hypothetical protein
MGLRFGRCAEGKNILPLPAMKPRFLGRPAHSVVPKIFKMGLPFWFSLSPHGPRRFLLIINISIFVRVLLLMINKIVIT